MRVSICRNVMRCLTGNGVFPDPDLEKFVGQSLEILYPKPLGLFFPTNHSPCPGEKGIDPRFSPDRIAKLLHIEIQLQNLNREFLQQIVDPTLMEIGASKAHGPLFAIVAESCPLHRRPCRSTVGSRHPAGAQFDPAEIPDGQEYTLHQLGTPQYVERGDPGTASGLSIVAVSLDDLLIFINISKTVDYMIGFWMLVPQTLKLDIEG